MSNKSALENVRLPQINTTLPGPEAMKIVERDHQFISPSYTRTYPLAVKRGRGAMLEDVDGNVFLDFNAGVAVCVTGHAHPKVVEAIKHQAEQFIHISGTDYYYPHLPALAERLNRLVPGSHEKRSHFGNSGAEAVEGAVKLAGLCHEKTQADRVLWRISRQNSGRTFSHCEQGTSKGRIWGPGA
jgi:4-aminobutyrate aminotransferase